MNNLQPLWDDVIVQVIPEKQKNIVTTFSTTPYHDRFFDRKCWLGKAIAVGEGYKDNGKFIPTEIKEGDYLLFPSWSSNLLKAYSREFIVVRERDVYCLLGKEDIDKIDIPYQRAYYEDKELDEVTRKQQQELRRRQPWRPK